MACFGRRVAVTSAGTALRRNVCLIVFPVPFVEDERMVFLKTVIPSRKATKQYLGMEPDDHEA